MTPSENKLTVDYIQLKEEIVRVDDWRTLMLVGLTMLVAGIAIGYFAK